MFTVHRQNTALGCTVVRPDGELDAATVGSFRRAMGDLAGSGPLVIDLSSVGFIDSTGLSALVGVIRRSRDQGGWVSVACGRPGLSGMLRRSGLDRIAMVAPTVAEAVEACPVRSRGLEARRIDRNGGRPFRTGA